MPPGAGGLGEKVGMVWNGEDGGTARGNRRTNVTGQRR